MITLNPGLRIARHPNFIMLKTYDNSPFNTACRLFNIAARNIDPSLPVNVFRAELLRLPDNLFEEWIAL